MASLVFRCCSSSVLQRSQAAVVRWLHWFSVVVVVLFCCSSSVLQCSQAAVFRWLHWFSVVVVVLFHNTVNFDLWGGVCGLCVCVCVCGGGVYTLTVASRCIVNTQAPHIHTYAGTRTYIYYTHTHTHTQHTHTLSETLYYIYKQLKQVLCTAYKKYIKRFFRHCIKGENPKQSVPV